MFNHFQPPLDAFQSDIETLETLGQASKLADQITKLVHQITKPTFDLAHVFAKHVNCAPHIAQIIEEDAFGVRHDYDRSDED